MTTKEQLEKEIAQVEEIHALAADPLTREQADSLSMDFLTAQKTYVIDAIELSELMGHYSDASRAETAGNYELAKGLRFNIDDSIQVIGKMLDTAHELVDGYRNAHSYKIEKEQLEKEITQVEEILALAADPLTRQQAHISAMDFLVTQKTGLIEAVTVNELIRAYYDADRAEVIGDSEHAAESRLSIDAAMKDISKMLAKARKLLADYK